MKRWWHIYDRNQLIFVTREDDPDGGTTSINNLDKTRVEGLAESTVRLLLGRVTTEAGSPHANDKGLCNVPASKYSITMCSQNMIEKHTTYE